MKERCVHLDEHHRRCRREATQQTHYFGDHESNQNMASWVVVTLCDRHAPPRAVKIRGPQ